MKVLKIGTIAMMAALMVACGGKGKDDSDKSGSAETEKEKVTESKDITLEPLPNLPVDGDDANLFAFFSPDGSENIVLKAAPDGDGSQGVIKADVKIKISDMPEPIHGFKSNPRLPLYIYNADKKQPGGFLRLEMNRTDADAVDKMVKDGNGGEITVTYEGKFYPSTYNEILSTAKYVQFQSASLSTVAEKEGGSSSNDSDNGSESDSNSDNNNSGSFDDDFDSDFGEEAETTTSVSSSSNGDWEKWLDEYEEYVDRLISLANKAESGDPTALNDYLKALDKANSLSSDLMKKQSTMTADVLNRYMEITQRLTEIKQ